MLAVVYMLERRENNVCIIVPPFRWLVGWIQPTFCQRGVQSVVHSSVNRQDTRQLVAASEGVCAYFIVLVGVRLAVTYYCVFVLLTALTVLLTALRYRVSCDIFL